MAKVLGAMGFERWKEDAGIGTGDISTGLARMRTDLATQRNYMASERTLMGWIRTALSMISFGFTLGKLGEALQDVKLKGVLLQREHFMSVRGLAYFLVVLGTVALLGATVQHMVRVRSYQAIGLERQVSITVIVAFLLALTGLFAFSSLVLEL